jgi:hypothetical protein
MTDPEVWRELHDEEIELLHVVVEMREQIKILEEVEKKHREQLIASMDGYTHGLINDTHVVTISRSRPERFNVSRFRQEHELLAQQYTTQAESDTVRVLPRPAARGLTASRGM